MSCDDTTPRARALLRLVLVLALAASASARAQPEQSLDEADERVEEGERLFAQGDYDGAVAQFERAYELVGAHPQRYLILYNIGQAHERRFRYDLAMRYYATSTRVDERRRTARPFRRPCAVSRACSRPCAST